MQKRNTDGLLLVGPLTRDQTRNPGLGPAWEWKQRPFASWDGTQPTGPHQSGLGQVFLSAVGGVWEHCR